MQQVKEKWIILAEQVTQERDPKKFMVLVLQLNQALAEREQQRSLSADNNNTGGHKC